MEKPLIPVLEPLCFCLPIRTLLTTAQIEKAVELLSRSMAVLSIAVQQTAWLKTTHIKHLIVSVDQVLSQAILSRILFRMWLNQDVVQGWVLIWMLSWGRTASKLTQVAGRIRFLVLISLRALVFCGCWLAVALSSQKSVLAPRSFWKFLATWAVPSWSLNSFGQQGEFLE